MILHYHDKVDAYKLPQKIEGCQYGFQKFNEKSNFIFAIQILLPCKVKVKEL